MNEPTAPELAPASPRPKPTMTPAVLAYRLRCLTDDLSRLAYAVPDADADTYSELMRARDAIWFAARKIHSPKGTP